MSTTETAFTLEYVISLLIATYASYFVYTVRSQANPMLTFFLVPLFFAYFSLLIMNSIFPHMNRFGREVRLFSEDQLNSVVNNWKYVQVLPPLLGIFLLTIVVLSLF